MSLSLDLVRAFVAVAETGGFTAAAKRLGVSKGQVSKEIARLESELGAPLFLRTTRQVSLTEDGARLQMRVLPLLDALELALRDAHRCEPGGHLRITVPADYFDAVLCPWLVEFARRHPRVDIELITDNQVRNVVADGIDVAVRLGWLRDSSLRATRIGEFELVPVAAPRYLRQHGTPRHPRELAGHGWIGLSVLADPGRFTFTHPAEGSHTIHLRPMCSANTVDAVLAFARAGLGITIAADFAVRSSIQQGTLQQLLPEWSAPRGGIYLVWPRAAQEPAKVRALVSFLKTGLGRVPSARQGSLRE
ncbi:LysR family transcriptional regulator [Pseudomonas sp. Hp2]|uniref:LysR family transcriptional regulator n=1 Tax=Pseudomonas sp. Hp2 TaxID=701189 RepID=UPI00112DAF86|nr:LysR family transcriptional regulator [Pseudomonas sp. Hp2]